MVLLSGVDYKTLHYKMRIFTYLILFYAVLILGCKTRIKNPIHTKRERPEWTQTRPIDPSFYIGIGVVNKKNGIDFQSTAKKNALNDLVSEIKITVSTNSVLNQQQNNQIYKQSFESETKVAALNTIEGFEIVDSWEDETNYWVYYRLLKENYHGAKKRKMMAAVDRAETFYRQALSLHPVIDYSQSLRLKVRALAAVQDYLNENIESNINGRNVSLISDIFQSMQQQLVQLRIRSTVQEMNGKVGRPLLQSILAEAFINGNTPVPFVPLTIVSDIGRVRSSSAVPTNDAGKAELFILSIMSRDPVQTVRIVPDMNAIISVDSLNITLKSLLMGMDVSSHLIRLKVVPLQIFLRINEHNLGKSINSNPLETIIRRALNENGCTFINNASQADYTITLSANTRQAPAIWGNMQTADLDLSISLFDNSTNSDVFKDGLQNIKGYHANIEQAGLDAYKQATEQFNRNILPRLMAELYRMN
jgi:hypothetical protein